MYNVSIATLTNKRMSLDETAKYISEITGAPIKYLKKDIGTHPNTNFTNNYKGIRIEINKLKK